MKILKLLLVLGFTSPFLSAQNIKTIDQQTQSWIRYNNIFPLTQKWSLNSDLDNRFFLNPVHENLFALRIQGRYHATKVIEIGAGLAYFNVNTQNPNVDPDYSIPEYRAQQDLTLINTFAKITFHNRFQLEERFIQQANKTQLVDHFAFSYRFRYRLQTTFDLFKKDQQSLQGILSNEIMFNFGKSNKKNTFDQNRSYAALRYQFNPTIGLELGYLKSFQRRSSGVDFYDRDIIRFTVYHRINRKSKV